MKNKFVITTAIAIMTFGAFATVNSYSFSNANLNMVSAEESAAYTLSFVKNEESNFDGKHGTTSNGLTWQVYGDQSQENALRVGCHRMHGDDVKSLKSQTPFVFKYNRVSKIVINHSGITNVGDSNFVVNSIHISGATDWGYTENVKEIGISSPSVSSPGSLAFQLNDDDCWNAKSYFTIAIHCKNPGEDYGYLTINSVDFYLEKTGLEKGKTRTQLGFTYSVDGEPATYEFSDVKLNFGGTCLKTDWNLINSADAIDYCGVAIARSTKLATAGSSIETLVENNDATIIKTSRVTSANVGVVDIDANGNISENEEGNYYLWHADMFVPEGMYGESITAVAYVTLHSGKYLFLQETEYSVKSIAEAYKSEPFYSSLSAEIQGAIDAISK